MLEVTPNDIRVLDDTALSELVIRLCEAELSKLGLPSSFITTGGAQDAPDGGIDAKVNAPEALFQSGYIPRALTGFQVKATPMSPGTVVKEMAPGGTIRGSIATLIANGGAYVIVCSKSSPGSEKLDSLRAKMRETAGVDRGGEQIVDFIGADRLALWCRTHPGVSAWVRTAAGRPTGGWLPFANWSRPSEGTEPEFILDQEARLIDERFPQDGPLNVEDGLRRVRALASKPGASIRLVGLSGVGKTRLAQAIFDPRIGKDALPANIALYCDYGAAVTPTPSEMARQLVERGIRIVLIVDNCSPETHRTLSGIVAAPQNRVSLVTIEYDVRDDDMEGTEVFRLEPSSDDVTLALIERRYPHINGANRRRIADIAGGNARIAMALAHTVRKGESLGRLRDDGLFGRLFFQRNQQDPGLLAAAEVMALTYSFDGESEGTGSELAALSRLAEQSVGTLKLACAELARRDLLQKRSHWRAVLPHAVANRVAARALDRLNIHTVGEVMEAGGERLLRSFSRRLSFLHDVPSAQRLAESWFGPDGRLGRVDEFSDLDFGLFRNLAPLAPEAALDAISRGAARDPTWASFQGYYSVRSRHELARLLRALAFEPHMFEQAAGHLVEIAVADTEQDRQQSNKSVVEGLFKLYLSGTMARPTERLAFARRLVCSGDEARASLGMAALDAMLECYWFGSSDSFDFGARPRGFGWEPGSHQDIADWFEPVVRLLSEIALSGSCFADHAKQVLARRFRGLWWQTPVREELTSAMLTIAEQAFWPEGWIATCTAARFAPEGAAVDDLNALELRLRPRNLLEQARAYGFSRGYGSPDLEEIDDEDDDSDNTKNKGGRRCEKAEKVAHRLAAAIAGDDAVRTQLLPDLVRTGIQRHWSFGNGLAMGAEEPAAIWAELASELRSAPLNEAEPALLRSFLCGWSTRDATAVEAIFDELLDDPDLGRWFPFFQTAIHPFNSAAVGRLRASLDIGLAPAGAYYVLQLGRATEAIAPQDFADIIRGISEKEGGLSVALQIFHMRLYGDREKGPPDPIIRDLGRELLQNYDFSSRSHRDDPNLAELAEVSLSGQEGAAATLRVLRRLKVAVCRDHAYGHEHGQLVAAIFRVQPTIALDFFLGRQFRSHQGRYARSLLHHFDFSGIPITNVPQEVLLAWAAAEPGERHRRVAACIPIFVDKEPNPSDDSDRWWPPALALLDAAPNRSEILAQYEERLHPRSWSGSRADILDRRREALARLADHPDPIVRNWSIDLRARLSEEIPRERARESRRQQSFE